MRILLDCALDLVIAEPGEEPPLRRVLVRALEQETRREAVVRELSAALTDACHSMDRAGLDTVRLKRAIRAWHEVG